MKLFPEEQTVLSQLLKEWYDSMHCFTEHADGIFSEKAKQYDQTNPVWERIEFPGGFVQEIRKKADRIKQLLVPYDGGKFDQVNWTYEGGVLEELVDICNYSRMMGGIILMKMEDQSEVESAEVETELQRNYIRDVFPRHEHPFGGDR